MKSRGLNGLRRIKGFGWVLDSACSFHMMPNKNWFQEYREVEAGRVLLGDDTACPAVGIGTVAFRMFDGMVRKLKGVRHVPKLRRNLISLGTLEKRGYMFKAANGKMVVTREARVVIRGIRLNNLYFMIGSPWENHAYATVGGSDATTLWHCRLARISHKGLQELSKQGVFGQERINSLDLGEKCVLGKQHRNAFKGSVARAKGILEYLPREI